MVASAFTQWAIIPAQGRWDFYWHLACQQFNGLSEIKSTCREHADHSTTTASTSSIHVPLFHSWEGTLSFHRKTSNIRLTISPVYKKQNYTIWSGGPLSWSCSLLHSVFVLFWDTVSWAGPNTQSFLASILTAGITVVCHCVWQDWI